MSRGRTRARRRMAQRRADLEAARCEPARLWRLFREAAGSDQKAWEFAKMADLSEDEMAMLRFAVSEVLNPTLGIRKCSSEARKGD